MPQKYRYEEFTWPEIREAVAQNRVCVLPVGTVEQHGPHLPLVTDVLTATEMSRLAVERMAADFAGTGLTIGAHPMTFHRASLALRGVLRAIDLPRQRPGHRVRIAGCVITRQRPGTAKGFVFLTLEDETGISNVIIRPHVYDEQRVVIVEAAFVLVEGLLQHEDGVTAVRAERVQPLEGLAVAVESHDFH
jgi:error-prone DNA polymerase